MDTLNSPAPRWQRRAQPLLGTLVEVGLPAEQEASTFVAAFDAIRHAQACLSRFDAGSDIARFNAAAAGHRVPLRAVTHQVLSAARALQEASDGLFDISLGSGPDGWCLEGHDLVKRGAHTQLDLGGIGKGHAVDLAVQALLACGCEGGWINAGGDLRTFGSAELPVHVRDEAHGGVRPFAVLRDGAFATSALKGCRAVHVSVAAPLCLWADALTKLVALSGNARHPLLEAHQAQAWAH